MRPSLIACTALLTLGACAGPSGISERTYRRDALDTLALKHLRVFVTTSGPPRSAGERFQVRGFPPPVEDALLTAGEEETGTRDALLRSLAAALKAKGYTTEFLAASVPTGFGQVTMVQKDLKLGALLNSGDGEADAVLVVRAVPVDAFHLDLGEGHRLQHTGLGLERVRDFKPVEHEGRLIVGQAFLFDARTGARLWTKQAPEYPSNGYLRPGHPFLKYGYVERKDGAQLATDQRAEAAATAFTKLVFSDFPQAKYGARLQAVAVEQEAKIARFQDRTQTALGLDLSYGLASGGFPLRLHGQEVTTIDGPALAPAGFLRVAPTVSMFAPSGWTLLARTPVSYQPTNLRRAFHRDPEGSDLAPQSTTVEVDALLTVGLEVAAGPTIFLDSWVIMVPFGGLFAEMWTIEARPGVNLGDTINARFGALAGSNFHLLFSERWFARLGVQTRVGYSDSAGAIWGLSMTAGAGFFL